MPQEQQPAKNTEQNGSNILSRLYENMAAIFSGNRTKKDLSRRQFLKVFSLASAAAAIAACDNSENTITPTPSKTAAARNSEQGVTPTPKMEYEKLESEINYSYEYENVRIFLDKNEIPIAYQFLNEADQIRGKRFFSDQEKANFLKTKQLAAETEELQVSDVVFDDITTTERVWDLLKPDDPTPEHPWIVEKPQDVVSNDKLLKYGVRILEDTSGEQPQIFFRQDAFEEGGLLQALRVLNENTKVETEKVFLQIFILNGPGMWKSSLTSTQLQAASELVKQVLSEEEAKQMSYIEKYRAAVIQESQDTIKDLRDRLATIRKNDYGQTSLPDIEMNKFFLFGVKANIRLHSSLSPAEMFFRYGDMKLIHGIDGAGWTWGKYFGIEEGGNTSSIVIPAGDGDVVAVDKVFMSYTPEGKFACTKLNTIKSGKYVPNQPNLPSVSKSYPRQESFGKDINATYDNEGYPYGPQEIGLNFRHEALHGWLMDWLPLLKKRKLLDKVASFIAKALGSNASKVGEFNGNEWLTDTAAMSTTVSAQNKFDTKDNTEYSVGFTIPKNKYTPNGAYMITENSKNQNGV